MLTASGRRRQRGAALLALAAIAVLGTTWMLLSAFGSAAARSTAQLAYNARALAEAKAALIAWVATRALDGAEDNPGRLPCPQAWGDVGSAHEGRAAAVCANPIGWLPWRTLGLPPMLDAAGRPLWYVVSPGWHLPNTGTTLTLNSNTAGQLTLDGRPAVALVIAPGAARNVAPNANQRAAGCLARVQSPALNVPANPRDYLECYSATAFKTGVVDNAANPVLNDQVVAITAADLLPALEAAIAKRIERDVVPRLKSVYASAAWGLDSNHPVFPFAAPFANPATSTFRGAPGTFEGLLPFNPARGFVDYAATPADAAEVLGYGAIRSQSCFWESAEVRRCDGEYQQSTAEPWRPLRIEMSATFSNVAMGLRALDPGRMQGFARDHGGLAAWQSLPLTYRARLNADGSATLTFGATLPNPGAMGWGSAAQFRLRIERAVIADHPLLSAADPATGWFVRNEWYRLVYYATSPGHAASGPAPRSCAPCLPVANLARASEARAILILAGRSLSGTARPNGLLADFLEGANAAASLRFESRAVNASFNDRVVVLDANP
jgi:hypothetical protein